jgi:serine/threonine protein kinase
LDEAVQTIHGRGSVGYRAPELLKEGGEYTQAVDIWAMGCILFEVATGRKAFPSEPELHQLTVSSLATPYSSLIFDENAEIDLSRSVKAMLEMDALQRPSAIILYRRFATYLWRSLGDALKEKNKLDLAIKAYRKGTTVDSTCVPLWEKLTETKEAALQRQVCTPHVS